MAACHWAVAALAGVAVGTTTMGVTQLSGRGVAVPVVAEMTAAVAAIAASVTMFSGVGVLVMITYSGVGGTGGTSGAGPAAMRKTGFQPWDWLP